MYYVVDKDSIVMERHSFRPNDEYLAGRIVVENADSFPLLSKYVGGEFYPYPGPMYAFDENLLQWVFDIDQFIDRQASKLSSIASTMIILADDDTANKLRKKYAVLLAQVKQMTAANHQEIDFRASLSEVL